MYYSFAKTGLKKLKLNKIQYLISSSRIKASLNYDLQKYFYEYLLQKKKNCRFTKRIYDHPSED